jgi:hypothetical protein
MRHTGNLTRRAAAGFILEDYRGNGLQLHFTVEDDGVVTTPWSATVTYWRPLSLFGQGPEFVCAENAVGYDRGKRPSVPTAEMPDF